MKVFIIAILGLSLILSACGLACLSAARSMKVGWTGRHPVIAAVTNGATDLGVVESHEIGFRKDGVVVWRKR